MRTIRRKRGKRQKQILILSTLALFSILTVGYAAFQTNIALTAKGNVHPTATYTVEQLKETVVTTGDGLYEDDVEGRYVYKGANPNNYLTLGTDTYRIIAIEQDNTLKVVKDTTIGSIIFDPDYSSSITDITSANSTTGTRYSSNPNDFCYNSNVTSYYGCKVWSSSETTYDSTMNEVTSMPLASGQDPKNLPSDNAYLNVYLNGGTYNGVAITGWVNGLPYSSLIKKHTFDIGPVAATANQTLAIDESQASAYKWKGLVGLTSVIDYVKANINTDLCGTVYSNTRNAGNYETCKTTNYLASERRFMTPGSSSYFWIWYFDSGGYLGTSRGNSTVKPVFHLASCVVLKGEGTVSKPFTIKNADTCWADNVE